jgi:hypothetical protein
MESNGLTNNLVNSSGLYLDKEDSKSNEEEPNSQTKIKKTRNRLTKKEQYQVERNELITQLNNIIGISDKKNYVYLYDLEHDEDIKKKISNLENNISKYHKCGLWGYYSNDIKKGKGNPITLLRAVYKDNDILITTKNKVINRDNKKVNSTVYYFNKIVK